MALNSNESGFLIGQRRLKEMSEGISQTKDNTKQILDVLLASLNELKETLKQNNASTERNLSRNKRRKARDASGEDEPGVPRRPARNSEQPSPEPATPRRRAIDSTEPVEIDHRQPAREADQDSGTRPGNSYRDNPNSVQNRAAAARERDSRGRFIGANGEEKSTVIKSLKDLLGNVSGGGDFSGIDPTLDALGELKSVVSPIGNVFSRMSAKAIGVFAGRARRRRNDEVLPAEQVRANTEQRRGDTRRNKLLERLIDAVRRNGGGRLGNLVGGRGMLGMLLGGGKALLKRLPFIGALLGGGMLAKDWGKLDSGEKGKGLGKLVGTIAGGMLGSLLGPAGTFAGGMLGNYLGGIFGEKVGEWTDSLQNIDFAKIFKDALKSIGDLKEKAANSPFMIPFRAAGQMYDGAKGYLSEKFGGNAGSQDMTAVSGKQKERQLAMYKALRNAGFSHEQSLAIGGEIGRENDYSDKMFSTHTDPAKDRNGKSIKNGGVLSWNRERYAKFSKFMRDRGLMDANGKMPETQATLNAQAEFIKQEMGSKEYSKVMKDFLNNPNQDPKKAAEDLAKYIGWARGQTTIQGEHGRVPFNSAVHERKINGYIDLGAEIVKKDQAKTASIVAPTGQAVPAKQLPAAKQPAQSPQIFKPGANRPAPVKVPAVTPELTKIGNQFKSVSTVPAASDVNISQNVSDRGMAHILSGGLGFGE